MSGERFTLDTNVLVHAFDSGAGSKRGIAREIIRRSPDFDCVMTFQALSEFYSATTRKRILAPAESARHVEDWLSLFRTQVHTASAIRIALREAVRGRFSFWDALLLATAGEGDCAFVISEDMGDGAKLGNVTVINPFPGDFMAAAASDLLT